MMEILNQNQGAVLCILTAMYVVATVALVWLGWKQIANMNRSLRHLEAAEENRSRPYVYFDLVARPFVVYAVLKNSGMSAAINVHVHVSPELVVESGGQSMRVPFVEHPVGFLAPGREIESAIGFGAVFSQSYPEPLFDVTVVYSDAGGRRYSESARIDLSYRDKTLRVGTKDVGEELSRIHEELRKITSNSFNPLIRIITESDYQTGQEQLIAEAKEFLQKIKNQHQNHASKAPTVPAPTPLSNAEPGSAAMRDSVASTPEGENTEN